MYFQKIKMPIVKVLFTFSCNAERKLFYWAQNDQIICATNYCVCDEYVSLPVSRIIQGRVNGVSLRLQKVAVCNA